MLLSHRQVRDAAVIGVYDDKAVTELPRAYVVPRDAAHHGDSQWCAQIAAYVAEKVSVHSKLRGGVYTVDSIPKTPSGKILRRHLRTLAAQQDHTLAKL